MTFMADFASICFSKTFISHRLADPVSATTALFNRLSVDDQLAVLWYAYADWGRSISPATPGSARLHLAEGLLDRIKQMSHTDQLQAMRNLVTKEDTQIGRSYGVMSPNTKLAFWYQLAKWMTQGFMVPVPAGYQLSCDGERVLKAVKELDFGQQITFLRDATMDMGVDPLAD